MVGMRYTLKEHSNNFNYDAHGFFRERPYTRQLDAHPVLGNFLGFMRPFDKGDYRSNHPFGRDRTSLIVRRLPKLASMTLTFICNLSTLFTSFFEYDQ